MHFTNDAATIRIFGKGLKDATHIYEKMTQMLTDVISEVENSMLHSNLLQQSSHPLQST